VRLGAPAKVPFAGVGRVSSTNVCSPRPTAIVPIAVTRGDPFPEDDVAAAGAAATNAPTPMTAIDAAILPLPSPRTVKALIFAPGPARVPAPLWSDGARTAIKSGRGTSEPVTTACGRPHPAIRRGGLRSGVDRPRCRPLPAGLRPADGRGVLGRQRTDGGGGGRAWSRLYPPSGGSCGRGRHRLLERVRLCCRAPAPGLGHLQRRLSGCPCRCRGHGVLVVRRPVRDRRRSRA